MPAVLTAIKKLSLGLLLIAGAAAMLLWSDLGSRNRDAANAAPNTAVFKVALVQYASQAGIDEAMRGVVEALKTRGYEDGGRLAVRKYNAEADIATANAIGKEVTSAGNDLIVSVTTASLQTIANANKNGLKTRHVFGLVTDPFSAGVGINPDNHMEHPPYMTGYGSMQPVANGFKMARTMRPELKTVGLVWNPAESNSVAQTKVARAACAELGITLVEANAENSTAAAEAASSLISRQVEAIWISGDVTALIASDAIIGIAKRAKIPVFTSIPPNADKGALFDFGSDFVEIGHAIGNLAADVLEGKKPADVPVENFVPPMFIINKTALAGLKDRWTIPDAVLEKANVVIDETGRHVKPKEPVAPPVAMGPLPRKMKLDLIEYTDTPNGEETREGFMAGLAKVGLQEGRDVQITRRNAQGDMATLSGMVDAALTDHTDMLVAASTPALQAVLRRGRNTPTVFMLVANPVLAGAGKSDTDHLPNVTGSYIPAPHQEAIDVLRRVLPNAKRLGTLFTPAEINSVFYKEQLEAVAQKAGLTLETVGVSSSGEIPDAALALSSRRLDVFSQISDNLTGAGFTSIAEAAKRYKLPLIAFAAGQMQKGAFMTVSRDYYDSGVEAAALVARALRGESLANMPFKLVPKIRYTYNLPAARQLGIDIPADLLAKADQVIR